MNSNSAKRFCIVAAILFGTLFDPACTRQKERVPDSPEKVTIAQAGDFFLYAPLYIAVDAELFKKQGLDVRLITTGGDDKTWAAVVSNSAQFGVADPTFVAVSRERGQPGKVVAGIVNGVPFWGVTFKQTIPVIKDSKQLREYSVATFPSPSTAYTLQRRMFETAGIEPKIVQGGFGTLLSIIEAGKADIALELEPNVSQAVTRGGKVVYALADVYGDFAMTGLTALPETTQNRGPMVQKVVSGLSDAMRLIRSDPERALAILGKRFPEVDAKVAKEALNRAVGVGIIPATTIISEKGWDTAIELRVNAGDLKAVPRFIDCVDNSFGAKAARP